MAGKGKSKPKKRVPCKFCGIPVTNLSQHYAVHKEKDYKCYICQKKLLTARMLSFHVRNHVLKQPVFTCSDEDCPCEYQWKKSAKVHKRLKIKYSPKVKTEFICKVCGGKYFNPQQLRAHYVYDHPDYESNNRKYTKCTKCTSTFLNYCTFLKHYKNKHAANKELKKYCIECDIELSTLSEWNSHKVLIHGGNYEVQVPENIPTPVIPTTNPVIPENCSALKRFQLIFNVGFPEIKAKFGCSICGDKFDSHTEQSIHYRIHLE